MNENTNRLDIKRHSPYLAAWSYIRSGGTPVVQALLKHSLVPLATLVRFLPDEGTILDLGCGEGILTNLVAKHLPNCQFVGFDRDPERISIAQRNAEPNARFEIADIFDLPKDLIADGAILNDVVHHQPYSRQWPLLAGILARLRPGAAIILKEVDQKDAIDRKMTSFFDSKLYPDDTLCFRSVDDWLAFWKRLGVGDVEVRRVRHPWPASRTLFLMHRPDRTLGDLKAEEIGAANLASGDDTVTVFLTGGTGFIGGHIARRLLHSGLGGKRVRLVMLCRDPDRMPADLVEKGAVPLIGELDDLNRLKPALAGIDYVFHLAAEVRLSGGTDLWRNNYQGTVELLRALEGSAITRFVHASTLGAVDRAPADTCQAPVDETFPANPSSDYGRAKLEAEKAIISSGLPYTIVRVTWGYGSGMTPDTHLRFLMQGVHDRRLFSFFDFPGRVSMIAVDDLVSVFLLVAEKKEAEGEIYFAAENEPCSLGQYFRRAGQLLGIRAGFIAVPWPVPQIARRLRRFLPLQLQNLNSDVLWASNAKLKSLGFRTRVSQRRGLADLARDMGVYEPKGNPVSIVTGAASGIGRALSERLHAEGHALLLIDKDESALKHLSDRLGADSLCLDLTDGDAVEAIEKFLGSRGYSLDWMVNNAGIGARGKIAEIDADLERRIIDLNVTALTRLSSMALKRFNHAGTGTLINIASSSAFQPLPFMATYAGTKSYVQAFTRSAVGEYLDNRHILIMTVNPSGTDTGFQAGAGVKQNTDEVLLDPVTVAEKIVTAAYARRSEITVGRTGRVMSLLARILPVTMQIRLWRHLMAKLR